MLISKEVTCTECGKKYEDIFWSETFVMDGICDECLECMDNE
jgi:hypothetical protein